MRKQLIILFLSAVIMSSCNGYHDSPTSASDVQNLNSQLEIARLNNAEWTNSPEIITQHLFPAVSSEGSAKRYKVTKRSTSNGTYLVTVLDEGAIDDEVMGERRSIELKLTDGKWNIINYRYAAKRRD